MGLGPRPGERPVLPQPGFSWPCGDNKMEGARGKEKSGAGASELNGGCHAQGSGGARTKASLGSTAAVAEAMAAKESPPTGFGGKMPPAGGRRMRSGRPRSPEGEESGLAPQAQRYMQVSVLTF